jgi:hypothetical protein
VKRKKAKNLKEEMQEIPAVEIAAVVLLLGVWLLKERKPDSSRQLRWIHEMTLRCDLACFGISPFLARM